MAPSCLMRLILIWPVVVIICGVACCTLECPHRRCEPVIPGTSRGSPFVQPLSQVAFTGSRNEAPGHVLAAPMHIELHNSFHDSPGDTGVRRTHSVCPVVLCSAVHGCAVRNSSTGIIPCVGQIQVSPPSLHVAHVIPQGARTASTSWTCSPQPKEVSWVLLARPGEAP
jgi:hypothetical protein